MLHGSYKVTPELTVTAYDYMIQNFAEHIGLRLIGKIALDDVKLHYTAEYAVQKDPTMTDNDDPILVPGRTDADKIHQDAD